MQEFEPKICSLERLRVLNLRKNLIADASGVQALKSRPVLEELELYDNLLKAIPSLEARVCDR